MSEYLSPRRKTGVPLHIYAMLFIDTVNNWKNLDRHYPGVYPEPFDPSVMEFVARLEALRQAQEREERRKALEIINKLQSRRKRMANVGRDQRTDKVNEEISRQQRERNIQAGLAPEGGPPDDKVDLAGGAWGSKPGDPANAERAGEAASGAEGSAPDDSAGDLAGTGQDESAGGSGDDPSDDADFYSEAGDGDTDETDGSDGPDSKGGVRVPKKRSRAGGRSR